MITIAEREAQLTLHANSNNLFESQNQKEIIDFDVEHNILAPMTIKLSSNNYHTLDLNIGRPFHLISKAGKIKDSSVCQHSNVAVLVSPGESVDLNWTPEFHAIRIILSARFVDQVLGEFNVQFQSTCNFSDPDLYELCVKLKEEKWRHENLRSAYAESLAIALVIHLASNYSKNGKKVFAPKGKLSSKQLNAIFEYTNSNVNKNIRLAEMASVVHISEFHFARLFKQTLGISPYRFVLQRKIEQAKKLIKNERRSCSDIAYILNFSDQAHFSHVFKKFTGFSPRTFMNATA
jgi:AraC family transcriptional regulator